MNHAKSRSLLNFLFSSSTSHFYCLYSATISLYLLFFPGVSLLSLSPFWSGLPRRSCRTLYSLNTFLLSFLLSRPLTSLPACDNSYLPEEQLCSTAKLEIRWQLWHHWVTAEEKGVSHILIQTSCCVISMSVHAPLLHGKMLGTNIHLCKKHVIFKNKLISFP